MLRLVLSEVPGLDVNLPAPVLWVRPLPSPIAPSDSIIAFSYLRCSTRANIRSKKGLFRSHTSTSQYWLEGHLSRDLRECCSIEGDRDAPRESPREGVDDVTGYKRPKSSEAGLNPFSLRILLTESPLESSLSASTK